MLRALLDLLGELPGLISDRVQLLALEAQRAAQSLARMVMLAVAAAVMLMTAWLALWGGVAMAAYQAGLHWALVLAVVVLVNAGAALLALRLAAQLAKLVALPATVRHLTLPASTASPEEEALHAAAAK